MQLPDIEREVALDFRTAPDTPYTLTCAHARIGGLSRYCRHVRGYPILGWPPRPGGVSTLRSLYTDARA